MLQIKKEEGVFKRAKDRIQKPLYSRENSHTKVIINVNYRRQ